MFKSTKKNTEGGIEVKILKKYLPPGRDILKKRVGAFHPAVRPGTACIVSLERSHGLISSCDYRESRSDIYTIQLNSTLSHEYDFICPCRALTNKGTKIGSKIVF